MTNITELSLVQLIQKIKKKDQKKLLSTNLKSIKSLIENYRVVEEKISENEYSAKIEITFSKKNINNFFFKKQNFLL